MSSPQQCRDVDAPLAKVVLQNITKKFGEVVAVNDLSLEIQDKEFLVLLGPSGCGKTTALRCIAGLESPDAGKIYIGDRLVSQLPPKDRDIAMVFQSYALYPHMTVYQNLAFPLEMRGLSKGDIDKKVKETAELLRIRNLLQRKPKQLSGGEQQRVALGRAIVREPKVFLMDEPLSNIDAKLRLYMRAELKRLQKDLSITTAYVTHDQAEAMTMADRIAVMNRGTLLQLSTPTDTYHSPSSTFVAGFLGSPPMNFIDCSFVSKDGKAFLDAGTFTLDVSELAPIIKEKSTSSEVMLGVRPEDTLVQKDRPRGDAVEAEIYVVEPLGADVIVDLKIGENILKAESPEGLLPTVGDRVWVSFRRNKLHIFDKKTENTII
jgi:multiple sugar transport system ATP-binding protein